MLPKLQLPSGSCFFVAVNTLHPMCEISAENAIKNLGVTEETLVMRAGGAIAEEILSRFKGGRILFVCGKGNNGADGKVASAVLMQKHGFKVGVCEVDGNLSAFEKEWAVLSS